MTKPLLSRAGRLPRSGSNYEISGMEAGGLEPPSEGPEAEDLTSPGVTRYAELRHSRYGHFTSSSPELSGDLERFRNVLPPSSRDEVVNLLQPP